MWSPGRQALKPVVLEWIITNGSLPGFAERLAASKSAWSVVGPTGMTVYRGQGHTKHGIPVVGDPSTLTDGVRPVIATSLLPDTAMKYAGPKCCLFEITLQPGVRYIDVRALFTFPTGPGGKPVTAVSNETIDALIAIAATRPKGYWLRDAIDAGTAKQAVRAMFNHRVHSELEVMVDGSQGTFEVTPIEHFRTFKAKYTRRGGRRHGRTYRRRRARVKHQNPAV